MVLRFSAEPEVFLSDALESSILMNEFRKSPWQGARSIVGALSGKSITIPDANPPPMPSLAATGVIHNGQPAPNFGRIDGGRGYSDVRSFKCKFGLLIPATNTTMEHELWSLVCKNPGLDGVGLHTANVMTSRPNFGTAEELLEYKRQFLDGLKAATEQVLLAQPQYLIMGMSLEHIIKGIGASGRLWWSSKRCQGCHGRLGTTRRRRR
jgi:maleate isomerase